jgi:hypothetical protein
VLQRSEHIAEWVRLIESKPAHVAPVSPKGGRTEGLTPPFEICMSRS